MKRTLISIALMAGLSTSAMASENTWQDQAQDAWIDGKAEATLLFNGELNSFDIETDVKDGEVILTGNVNNQVEKELAKELVMGIDGVESVSNKLTVMKQLDTMDEDQNEEFTAITDAKIATVIKSRFLFDSEVDGTDIDVEVENGVVTLEGAVHSEAERALAVRIARNADDVKMVNSEIEVIGNS